MQDCPIWTWCVVSHINIIMVAPVTASGFKVLGFRAELERAVPVWELQEGIAFCGPLEIGSPFSG